MSSRDEDFEEFAAARTPALLRSAWLLCGDPHQAEDLVQETLAKLYVRWRRPLGRGAIDNPAAYTQTALTRTFLSARRRRSAGEVPQAALPERAVPDEADARSTRLALLDALADLSPPDRAVLVLRYLDDLSVEDTAAAMGTSPGAVRTRASRAIARLRPLLDPALHPVPTHDLEDLR